MGCCNVRVLSYISASLQLVCCVIFLLFAAIGGVVVNSKAFKEAEQGVLDVEKANVLLVICVISCVIGISLLVTLIVGIQQHRLTLVSIYVYTSYVFLVLGFIVVIADLIFNIMREWPIEYVLIHLLINLAIIGLEIISLAPIFLLHRKMRAPPILPTTYSGPMTNPYGEV